MKDKLWMLSIKLQNALKSEEGQDLVEYALLVALLALGATVGMQNLANGINSAFTNLQGKLSTIGT